MKKILKFVILTIMCATMSLVALAATDTSFRVVSFNILNSDDKETRFDAIKTTLSELSPDVLGFQECREGFNSLVADVKATGYESVVDKLVDDPNGNTIINCVPILYNTDRFSLIEGSAGARRFVESYQGSWTKSMCYCVLEDKVTSQQYIVMNMHFAVYSADYGYTELEVEEQRASNANEVLAQIEAMQSVYGDIPVILMGDLNAEETEKAYRILLKELTDAAYIADDSEPYHTSSHSSLTFEQTGGYPIDHVFVSGNTFDVSVCKPYVTETSYAASDHYPVYADLMYSKGSGGTCDEAHATTAPIVILDAVKRTLYLDTLEGFTIMNVSTKPVDLSHIIVWSGTAETEEGLDALTPSDVGKVMRLSEKRGEVVLEPGEKAYVWCIFNSSYSTSVVTLNGGKQIISQGEDGKPVYHTDIFRKSWEYLATTTVYTVKTLDSDTKIIPLDRTTRDVFGSNGDYRFLANSFNMPNDYFIRLYVSYDTALDVSEAFFYADLDGTGGGTYIDEEGLVTSILGMYSFVPEGDVKFMNNTYIFGGFTMVDLLSALRDCISGRSDKVWDMNHDKKNNLADIIYIAKNMVSY